MVETMQLASGGSLAGKMKGLEFRALAVQLVGLWIMIRL